MREEHMKYLSFLLFIICSFQFLLAQKNPPISNTELNVQTKNADSDDVIKFKLIPIKIQFCRYNNNCTINTYSSLQPYSITIEGNLICTDVGYGLRFCDDDNEPYVVTCGGSTTQDLQPLRHGMYKVEVWLENRDQESTFSRKKFFYYDNRDDGLPNCTCSQGFSGNDLMVRYDIGNDELQFFKIPNIVPGADPDQILASGDLIIWSDWTDCDYRDFIEFWPNGLVIVGEQNPILVWGPYNYDNFTVLNYIVYRAINYSSTPPSLGSFTSVATLNSSTYTWTDNNFCYGGPNYVHYYVIAESPSGAYSPPTNISTVNASLYKSSQNKLSKNYKNNLVQNHPNPFNPSTYINFSITETEYVSLIVYDVLGKEVARLADGIKAAGNHQVEFQAGQLPSGIYFYELKAGIFRETKKMILTK